MLDSGRACEIYTSSSMMRSDGNWSMYARAVASFGLMTTVSSESVEYFQAAEVEVHMIETDM